MLFDVVKLHNLVCQVTVFCVMNRILGNRVAELEGKLKALEMSGLWSLPGNHTCTITEVSNKCYELDIS